VTNFSTGRVAEEAAVKYLQNNGHKIIDQNWRTRYCEIDIVAVKKKTVYFVEVKYRANMFQGSGLEYITSKKLKQMSFAAEMWVQANNWNGGYSLAAIEVSGPDFEITNFLTEL